MLIENGVLIQNGISIDCMCDSNWNDTVFLCHFDGTNAQTGPYTDNSAAQTIIQTYGTASLTTSQKYFGTASLNLDGSGYVKPDYPSGKNPTYDLGTISSTTNFTIEFYTKKPTVTSAYTSLISHALPGSGGDGVGGWSVYTQTNGYIGLAISKNTTVGTGWYAQFQTNSTVINSTSTWYHVAIVLISGVPKIFINGTEQAASFVAGGAAYASSFIGFNTSRTNYGIIIGAVDTDSTNPTVGNYYTGYIDDLRITTNVARYTSNFTVPDTPYPNVPCTYDEYFRNVSLLLPMNGISGSTNFIDYSPSTKIITVNGNTSISPAQSKWGGSSGYFDGSGDYLRLTTGNEFNFGYGDFTIECWAYVPNYATERSIFYKYVTWASNLDFALRINVTGTVQFIGGDGGGISITSNSAIATNQWVHIAVTRSAGTTRMFIDGVTQTNTSSNVVLIPNDSTSLYIGVDGSDQSVYFLGYMDDVRITNGVARYTSSFTPPTQSFPIVGC